MLSIDEAVAHVTRVRNAGGRVVFTNGVFDLLHPGHLRYLKQARALGDTLIVGINTDRSVRVIKGESRPITPEHERGEILAAMDCVDGVVLFDEETPYELIKRLQPDVIVKGADWSEASMIGRDIVEARGGQVVRVPFETGYSTTTILEKIGKIVKPEP
jgi:D-beta-D-heptose 7-phosphate kinase/D-beta-D-heptose 1-phosphate adenosyltransferase